MLGSCFRRPLLGVVVLVTALLVARGTLRAQTTTTSSTTSTTLVQDSLTDVTKYAAGCYAALAIAAGDLKDNAGNVPFNCEAGTPLPTRWTYWIPELPDPTCNPTCSLDAWSAANPVGTKPNWPDGSPRMADGSQTFPAQCDDPAWLSGKCYGHSYVQRLKTGNRKVAGVLLCRHKTTWDAQANNYDDIAIILHNVESGKTCWFQALSDTLNGQAVPAPHDAANAAGFWLSPQATASHGCADCHDNGPFMRSPWISTAGVVPDDKWRPYSTVGVAFAGWPQITRASVGSAGLPRDEKSCTGCHPISAKRVPPAAHPDHQGSCTRWIEWTTGGGRWRDLAIGEDKDTAKKEKDFAKDPASFFSKFSASTNRFGQQWEHAGWMWPGHGYDRDRWTRVYKEHLKALLKCCDDGSGTACKTRSAWAWLSPTPGPTTVTAAAAVGQPPRQVVRTATVGDPFLVGSIAANDGESVTFSWDTNAVSGCGIVATLPLDGPEGVYFDDAKVTLPPDPYILTRIDSGTSWSTATGSVELGPLTVPGAYVFDVDCETPLPTSGEYEDTVTVSARVAVDLVRRNPVYGSKLFVRDGTSGGKLVYVANDPTLAVPPAGGSSDPMVWGASFAIVNPTTLEQSVFDLPEGLWTSNASGTMLKYKNKLAPGGGPSPVRSASIKSGQLKVIAKGLQGFTLNEGAQGSLGAVFTTGHTAHCSRFATAVKDAPGTYLSKNQPPPLTCDAVASASGAFVDP